MTSGKIIVQFDADAPATPTSGESIIYPLGPDGAWYEKLPSGEVRRLGIRPEDVRDSIFNDRDAAAIITEDWGGATVAGTFGWLASNSIGTNVIQAALSGEYNRAGIVRFQISGDSSAIRRSVLCRGLLGTRLIGQSNLTVSINVKPDANVLAPAENSRCIFGLTNGAASGVIVNGVYFMLEPALSSNWLAVCTQTSNSTIVDTGVPALGEIWKNICFHSNGVNEVTFKIDGVEVASITTNLPFGADDVLTEVLGFYRTATGTTNNSGFWIDSYFLKQVFGVPRW